MIVMVYTMYTLRLAIQLIHSQGQDWDAKLKQSRNKMNAWGIVTVFMIALFAFCNAMFLFEYTDDKNWWSTETPWIITLIILLVVYYLVMKRLWSELDNFPSASIAQETRSLKRQ